MRLPIVLFVFALVSASGATQSRPVAFLSPGVAAPKRTFIIKAKIIEDEPMSTKEQYNKAVEEYNRLERLIKQSAAADKADGHTLETVFNDDDVAEIAELMLEKATAAAAAKALYEEEQAHLAAVTAKHSAEEATMFEGMAQKAAQELHAMEDKLRDIESFDDEAEDIERKRDMSAVHATKHTLQDAKQHAKEAKLAKNQARLDEAHARKDSLLLKLNEAELKEDMKELHNVIVEKTNKDFKEHKP